ncbi:hypothetical protein HK405_011193, partial [Cladochytrium tenue]
ALNYGAAVGVKQVAEAVGHNGYGIAAACGLTFVKECAKTYLENGKMNGRDVAKAGVKAVASGVATGVGYTFNHDDPWKSTYTQLTQAGVNTGGVAAVYRGTNQFGRRVFKEAAAGVVNTLT